MARSQRPARDTERDPRLERILALVDSVPPGKVATYGQIAREAGLGRGARQVGRALRQLPPGTDLAWHRIVNAQGRLSPRGDDSSLHLQRRRLRAEGVRFDRRGRIDLSEFQWHPEW